MDLRPFGQFKPLPPGEVGFFAKFEARKRDADLRRRLEEVVGHLTDDAYASLRDVAREDLQAAVLRYLEPKKMEPEETIKKEASPTVEEAPKSEAPSANCENEESQPQDDWDSRYIGSFQGESWCTRSGVGLVKFGDKLRVERLPTNPEKLRRGHEDLVVRLYTSTGREVARASEADARFMSILMDARVAEFSATVIFCPERLRLGDSLIVQIDCCLLRSAFRQVSVAELELPKRRAATIVDESKESVGERLVRLRQVGLVALFERVGATNQGAGVVSDLSPGPDPADLNNDQLDVLYRDAVSASSSLASSTAEPSSSFALQLYPYQKRGLRWMLDREQADKSVDNNETHPLWTEFGWPNDVGPFWCNLNSGELSLVRPTLEARSRGGILADEMGLGKTVSTLALICTSDPGTTLIVAPMSLLAQWESEARRAIPSCQCFVYYGPAITGLGAFMASPVECKIVITSYGMIVSEHNNDADETKGLLQHDFIRVVLDEAHSIKNRQTQTAKACFAIRAARRWALTGTPIVNRLEDLYSLVRFIGLEPWDNFTYWRAFVTEPFDHLETRERAMRTVQAIVAPLCLRRTKAMVDPETGKPLVELPEKTVEIRRVEFSADESDLYSYLYANVRDSVRGRILAGTALTKYTAILALVLQLRQACCHPLLLRRRPNGPSMKRPRIEDASQEEAAAEEDTASAVDLSNFDALITKFSPASTDDAVSAEFTKRVVESLSELEMEECIICRDTQTDPAITECLHTACLDCLMAHLDHLRRKQRPLVCHVCRAPVNPGRIYTINKSTHSIGLLTSERMQSTKVRALISALHESSVRGLGKAVVFSQFTSFLDIIERELAVAGFCAARFDGSMSQAQRAAAIEAFRSEPRHDAVLLLSLKAGGVGLNLTCATQAYLMDPWWSYAVESQAIDRIHRMGQTGQIRVVRFIVAGTIEERMLQIQERKRALSTVVTEEERKTEQLENIRLLFDLQQ